MALLDLPPELLSRIIKETIPESFENMAVTCKTVYNASQFFLPKHNELRGRYRNFSYDRDWELQDGDTCTTSLQLISRIAEEPVIARYIVSADFKDDKIPKDKETCKAQVQQITASPYVLQLLENSSYLQSADIDPSTILQHLISQHKPDGTASLAATFLLTLLPNVTTLALPRNWETSERLLYSAPTIEKPWEVWNLVDEIVKRANDPSDPSAGLSKLTSILPSTAWGYENKWALSVFTPFLSIKSVRNFCVGSPIAIDDGYTGRAYPDPEQESFGENLEVVQMAGGVVDHIEVRKFLSRTPRLRSFAFNFECKWHGCGSDWDAGAFMAAVEDEVGDTLEKLSLTIVWVLDGTTGIKSMKKFRKLKELELDIGVLIGPPYTTENEEAEDDQKDDVHEEIDETAHQDVPRLSSILPSTIQRLSLLVDNVDTHSKALDSLFSGIALDKLEKLPHLKEVVICNPSEGYSDDRPNEVGSDVKLYEAHEVSSDGDQDHSIATCGVYLKTGSTIHAEEQSTSKSPRPQWRKDLESLGSSVAVRFVKARAEPYFMRNFCARYGVEMR